jgi:NAD(P)-dependent dehydrogenase (short-subunit alcohol dehydrogenase family)
MNSELSNQVAIVTGGAKGYGAGITEALKRRGVNVWITGRDEKRLKEIAGKLNVHAVKADVTKPGDWDRLFDTVLKAGNGRLDILINNAGAGIKIAPTAEQTDQEIEESIAVNLTGAIFGSRRAAAIMCRQKSGTIINISSVCAREAWPGWAIYSAAKGGLIQFSKCLYTELRSAGVRVTSVIPSWGATEFSRAAGLSGHDQETNAKCIQPVELGELIVNICALPPHLEIQDITVWPLVQEVMPL